MSESYEQLKNLSREELIERHDANSRYTQVGISHYLGELRHRDTQEVLSQIEEHTASIARCADIVANYILARWKAEARNSGTLEDPPMDYLGDPRNKINP